MDSTGKQVATSITLAGPAEYAEEIKKSRFIARAFPVDSTAEALKFLEKVRQPQATHNCWAYRLGIEYRFNDDGEPGGTAGRPILGAIERQGIDRVIVVVIRYFGGIKLGAGGLARAYGGVAGSCLRLSSKRQVVPMVELRLSLGFEHVGSLHQLAEKYSGSVMQETFTSTGLSAILSIRHDDFEAFKASALDATNGQAIIQVLKSE